MFAGRRRLALDAALVGWGLGSWLGVNGVFVQMPLLVRTAPEGWQLAASMTLAVQLGNAALLLYWLARRLAVPLPDRGCIAGLLALGCAALALNAALHGRTAAVLGAQVSLPFLALTFFSAVVGCSSSVLFYPYMRHLREAYLATYLVGEGASGLVPALLALAQGSGGDACELQADNVTWAQVPPEPAFGTGAFLGALAGFAAAALACFLLVDSYAGWRSERVAPAPAAEKRSGRALASWGWAWRLGLCAWLAGVGNGALPAVASFACMPFGARAYHLAASLGAAANPLACLLGVWLPPPSARRLLTLLAASSPALLFVFAAALLSPAPPLHDSPAGEPLIVGCWVLSVGAVSWCRMGVYAWAREGGGGAMRAAGGATQLGSALAAALFYALVHHTRLFAESAACS